MGGISIWQLLIVLVIVLVLFGTKKIRNLGADLGSAIKNFKKSVKDESDEDPPAEDADRVIEGEVTKRDKEEVS